MAKKKETVKMIRVTLVKSVISSPERQKATVRALGLNKLNQTIEHVDSAAIRGMLAKVSHLVHVEEQV
jgi:large subunit ribosomal protein L30